MKTINYKWIGGNNLRKRTDGERTKRNQHIASFRMSCLFASLCRMCSGFYRFQSIMTTVYGYLACFFVIFFAIPLLISGKFVTIPINKTAKKFQQKYLDSQEEKRK